MVDIILSGCCGKMGRVITRSVAAAEDCRIVAGIDINKDDSLGYPVFSGFDALDVRGDVVIDFSHPSALDGILAYCKANGVPAVLATTGYSPEQTETIKRAAADCALFFTFNMSLGINLLIELTKKATCILGDAFDIEIIEAHHNQKIDAPSGTAVMIADAVKGALSEDCKYVYDRHSERKKRDKNEIGIHSIRGGTIVGEHTVMFAGHDEILSISHSARSKEIFATGAVKAAQFMVGKPNGMYSMNDMIE